MKVSNFTLLVMVFLLSPPLRAADNKNTSYGDALESYEQYWQTFEKYDNRKIKDAHNKYQEKWSKLKEDYERKILKKSKEQFDELRESVKKYRLQLQEHPDSNNRPFVLLNLAQVYSIMANLQTAGDKENNKIYLDYALKIIEEIETTYPRFTHIENALYLKATILDQLKRNDEALQTWSKLAIVAKDSKYGLYGIIGMGDHYFTKDEPENAIKYFRKAKETLPKLKLKDEVYESLRVHYRLAWAAYRTADLEESIEAATGLLTLRLRIRNPERQQKVFDDAIELTGDALYEKNDLKMTRQVLQRRELHMFADSIGDRILKRFDTNNIHSGTVEIGKFLFAEFPLSSHIPDWHLILGRAYDELGQEKQKIDSLERLAMLLPKNSLWQNRHRSNFQLINKMMKNAEEAARVVAAHYYDVGIATANPSNFLTSASYYGILATNLPDHKDANHWRLRQAHCYYFGDKIERAIQQYNFLISQVELNEGQLEIALYQLALASEKVWRRQYAESSVETDDLKKKEDLEQSLQAFADNTEKFANRFPDNTRSVDLLLLVAAAYRDSNQYEPARVFWKRVLVSSPSISQRLIAIRGLIYAEVNAGKSSDVAALTERFLRLEDWGKVDPNFRQELLSILSSAIMQHSDELNKSEKPAEAGKMLVEQAQQFRSMPNRERIYRDGAYMLAIGDDWRSAQEASEEYLNEGLSAFRDDMLYLNARAYEFRLNFKMAAQQYIALADTYPNYKRTVSGLTRAERLAVSDKDWMNAAKAATLMAQVGPKEGQQDAISRAVDYYNRAERHDLAKKASQYQLRVSTSLHAKLTARLNHAKAKLLNDENETAAKELSAIAGELKRQRVASNADYADISGETHFLLAEDIHERFDDFKLQERSGTLSRNVAFKMKLFEKMSQYYDLAIDSTDPEWGARSRYSMGVAAGEFADEIARAIVAKGEQIKASTVNELNKTVTRLHELKNNYHSQNILARTQNPARYKNNTWVEKSHAYLNYGENSKNLESGREDNLPIAIYSDMSNVWSH